MKISKLLSLRFATAMAASLVALSASASDTTVIKHADRNFIEKAAKSGMAEVDISRVAAERTSNPKIREFAQMLVSHHESANDALASIATDRGVALPAKDNDANKWSKKDAKDFDKDYINKMVSDHEEAVKEFQKEANEGKDPETVAFARKILPQLQHHLEQANDFKRMLK